VIADRTANDVRYTGTKRCL